MLLIEFAVTGVYAISESPSPAYIDPAPVYEPGDSDEWGAAEILAAPQCQSMESWSWGAGWEGLRKGHR